MKAFLALAVALAACGERRASAPAASRTDAAAEVPLVAAAEPRAKGPETGHGLDEGPLLGTCTAAKRNELTDDRRIDALLDEAGRHLDGAAWGDAFTCADMAADLQPRSIEAHHLRAAALAGAGHDGAAATAYAIALALDPEDPETLRAAADFYINVTKSKTKDTTALGLELARRGSARGRPRRRNQHELRGQLALLEAQALNDLGHSDDALERATEAVRLSATLVDAVHERGVALFNLGRFADARTQFERVLTASPDDAYAHHLLGLTLEQTGAAEAAEAHFARARTLAPDEFPAPVVVTPAEMEAEIAAILARLPADRAARLRSVPIQVVDFPDPADLGSVSPPFPPTILGLYRGLPVGVDPLPGEEVPTRAILLYRMNLARAVRTRAELTEQIERTLLHEIGHLEGLDEDDLRRHDLE